MSKLSIIIPVYNGTDVISESLNSIYSQGMAYETFEVVCVDDCSPTMSTVDVLNSYTYNGIHPLNLKVIREEKNKRQGGARNTALNHAEGEWILYLDQDDKFVNGSLVQLQPYLSKYAELDCIMFDCKEAFLNNTNGGGNIREAIYSNQNLETDIIYSGREFIKKYPMPWSPWCYAYKKVFLVENNLKFVEHVRFPDTDFVMKSTLLARGIVFVPIEVYCHMNYSENTSTVGNDLARIEDLLKLTTRMRDVALNFIEKDKDAALAAMKHHTFRYEVMLKTILWRLPYVDIVKILKKYPPYPQGEDRLVTFVGKHPYVYAIAATIARPFLLLAWKLKKRLR